MLKPEQVPDEVVNAIWRDGYEIGDGLPARRMQFIRNAIAAAINAWPGGEIVDKAEGDDVALLLPLPQEVGDA